MLFKKYIKLNFVFTTHMSTHNQNFEEEEEGPSPANFAYTYLRIAITFSTRASWFPATRRVHLLSNIMYSIMKYLPFLLCCLYKLATGLKNLSNIQAETIQRTPGLDHYQICLGFQSMLLNDLFLNPLQEIL